MTTKEFNTRFLEEIEIDLAELYALEYRIQDVSLADVRDLIYLMAPDTVPCSSMATTRTSESTA